MSSAAIDLRPEDLRGYVDYLRDLGIFDLYIGPETSSDEALLAWYALQSVSTEPAAKATTKSVGRVLEGAKAAGISATRAPASPFERSVQRSAPQPAVPERRPAEGRPTAARSAGPQITITPPSAAAPVLPAFADEHLQDIFGLEMAAPVAFNLLAPQPEVRVAPDDRAAALDAIRRDIGDCTRCPLAYAGRHKIVFGDGDPNARLLFVGEGPGADEDESGVPFVGKAGQLLNNMIAAMGLQRKSVYIANIVKCRPPKNRQPEPVEANTCSQFLLRQIDTVQPEVIVALGATAATYLLGLKQSLSSLRGQWFDVRGAKCAVTYHPAYLLRDPRQKGEAWKDLQRVMVQMQLTPPARG